MVSSGEGVACLIAAAPNAKYQTALSVANVRCATRAASMPPSRATLDEHAALDSAASGILLSAAARLGWSARGFPRVLRVARAIADLADSPAITSAHLAEAIQYRRVLVRPS